ncbi:unnamed protein product [Cylicocyclus nassatus]|uniref:Uncharacterized protein n=1 Tax=Cylicocyclus nassatus TaxID=53992 RepID=A0AA36H0Y2_CYLNA|nr:unnamed protein product [Cylicocyclus nassatus]
MVRVLPTGEVVSDDDPRVRQRSSAPRPQAASSSFNQPQAQAGLGDSFVTIWNNANDRLRHFGLNSFEVAGYRVDPLHLLSLYRSLQVIMPPQRLRREPQAEVQMMLALRGSFMLGKAFPCCSTSVSLPQRRSPQQITSNRQYSSTLPPAIGNLFMYASDCYFTQGLQFVMESLHGAGLSWPYVFIASGVALRIASSPLHIFAEKLFARRLHAQNFFTEGILKKLSQHHKVELVPNASRTKLELKTSDPRITAHSEQVLSEMLPQYMSEHGLQATRIQNLKMCTIPLWIFSSFAVRNVITSDFHPSIAGGLWIPDMLVPDPYFVLPVAVGLFGFLNLYSQRKIYPMAMKTWKTKSYDFCLGFFTCFAVVIMCQLPACIPLYWLSVSVSGFLQAQLLRHPNVKKLFGIARLPTDSRTPIRDLFMLRPKQA